MKLIKAVLMTVGALTILSVALGLMLGPPKPSEQATHALAEPPQQHEPAQVAPRSQESAAPAPRIKIDKSPEMQAERERLLQKLRQANIFGDVRCRDDISDVIVKPAFYGLEFQQKEAFVNVAYAYCFSGEFEYATVYLRDSLDNNERGTFNALHGLKLD